MNWKNRTQIELTEAKDAILYYFDEKSLKLIARNGYEKGWAGLYGSFANFNVTVPFLEDNEVEIEKKLKDVLGSNYLFDSFTWVHNLDELKNLMVWKFIDIVAKEATEV